MHGDHEGFIDTAMKDWVCPTSLRPFMLTREFSRAVVDTPFLGMDLSFRCDNMFDRWMYVLHSLIVAR
jgi:hypothetical protein